MSMFGPVQRQVKLAEKFASDTKAVTAVWLAIMIVPLILAVGGAVDVGRAITVKTQLQRAADSAALAGATIYTSSSTASAATTAATNYMNQAISALRGGASATFTVVLSTVTASSTTTDYVVTVKASASLNTTIMNVVQSLMNVGASAVADNPVYVVKLSLNSFSSSAADGDIVYYYIVPSDGSAPTTMTKIFNNEVTTSSQSAISVSLTAGQSLGFALKNITGDQTFYPLNGYGGLYESTHVFYSHMSPPSIIAYPLVTQNCSLQIVTSLSNVKMGCQSTTPALGKFNCASAGTTPYYFAWNDMGGLVDDKDFNDAVFKVGCTSAGSSVNGVVLTN